jgi:hypothetical protein
VTGTVAEDIDFTHQITLTIGPSVFALTLTGFAALARRTMAESANDLVVRFPREP